MSQNTITITLDDVLGPDGLEGAWDGMVRGLVERAESRFLHSNGDGKSFHKAAVEAINRAVEDRLVARIEEKMRTPFQPTDTYGNPKGEPISFDEMIGQAVETAMKERVDAYGNPKLDGGMSLFQHAVQRVALEGLKSAVTAEAKRVNADAKEAVAKELAAAIAKTLET